MNRLLNITLIAMMSMLLHGASMSAQILVNVRDPGTLASLLTQEQRDTCIWLIVRGKLNTDDVRVLRSMAGAQGGKGHLECLDLKQARFVRDNRPYMVLDVDKCNMTVHVSPKNASLARLHGFMMNHIEQELTSLADWSGFDRSYNYLNAYFYDYRLDSICISPRTGNDSLHTSPKEFQCNVLGIEADFKFLRRISVAKDSGYAFETVNGKNLYKAYLQRNTITDDMFYGTTTLRMVILPKRMMFDPVVMIKGSKIRFFRPK